MYPESLADRPSEMSAERHRLLVEWNETAAPYPSDRCIHELFEAQVRRDPSAAALVFEGERLSYGALNARANRLAHHLRQLGVGPDDLVALCAERSIELVVAVLAVLKAGGAYVPLDPTYPAERLALMLQDSAPRLVLCHAPARAALAGLVPLPPVLDLLADAAAWADEPATDLDPTTIGLTARHLAYVIYTSGSTGTPKGVMVEHGNVVKFACDRRYIDLRPGDQVAHAANPSFDAITFELWSALLNGAEVHVIGRPILLDLDRLVTLLKTSESLTIFLTTALFNEISARDPTAFSTLRRLLFGGEKAQPRAVHRVLAAGAPGDFLNVYGPTECTTFSTFFPIAGLEPDDSTVPIGRPITNTRIYLLDEQLQPVPCGAAGELHIGGAGVARGYLNRPELTAERFIDSPFVAGDRLYKTGDLARYRPDGTIEFIGRNDFQVKLRGFRIELGEIEARLVEHPGVREAVVLARDDGDAGQRLVAYYRPAEAAPDIADLRAHLATRLPDFMVPPAYVRLNSWPLTSNGKLDRKALPAPDDEAYAARAYEQPRGPVETVLAGIWSEVLGVARVGRHDNFFDLGGHSLLAIRVLDCMRRAGLGGDVRALFQAPDLAALAEAIGAGEAPFEVPANRLDAACSAITPALLPLIDLTQSEIDRIVAAVPGGVGNIQDIYPLAPLQEGILFHHMMVQTGDVYLLQSELSFASRERLDAYVAAMNAVIARHDILRTAVLWEGLREPVQVVLRGAALPVKEVELDPADGDIATQLRARFDPRRIRLNLCRAPLMRLVVAPDPVGDRWVGLWLFHHMMGDGASVALFTAEISAHLAGAEAELPRPLPFRNFVAQARLGLGLAEHEAFFRRMLGDVTEPTAPFGLSNVLGDGAAVHQAIAHVDAALGARLRARARALGVSAASLFHVAWGLVLARASGRADPVFGTVLFGRMQGGEGADQVLGLFINTLPIRLPLGDVGAAHSVRETHRLLAELMRHELAPLAVAQRCSGLAPQVPLFAALLNYRHGDAASARGGADGDAAWQGIEHRGLVERTNYPLVLSIDDLGSAFRLTAQSAEGVAPQQICAMTQRALESLAEALEHSPERSVDRLDVLPPEERHRLLAEWNDTVAPFPADRCIHELFEDQVQRDPSAVAVVFEGERLSYGALNARANRLAHHLRQLGVGPDDLVALCVERSPEMVVGLLAVLKAGGAYVPLDPTYPAERLALMLQDSVPKLVLGHAPTRAALRAALAGLDPPPPVLDLLADASWADQPATDLAPATIGLNSRHLAYLIYTSGSTGRPKGVMNEHRGLINRLLWMQAAYELTPSDAVLQKTPYGFDVSVWEFFWTLMTGARLVMARPDGHKDPAYLVEVIHRERVTVLHFVPSMLRLFLEYPEAGSCTGLTDVICSGEALPAALAQQFGERLGGAKLHNLYGPTEAAIDVTAWTCPAQAPDCLSTPIGRPIWNTRIYLLDARLEPVPCGLPGEIHIGGVGVARGYLNRPELTAERFIDSPFLAGDRLYKTGDLGRYLPDGNIEFLGRNDFQVKLRGFRIELGEIEARLAEHPGVREALVLARADGTGETGLVAYYIPTSGRETEIADLKVHLAALLPDYMVPAAYLQLETWPLTPNGKLDRKALPAPDGSAFSTRGYVAPVGPLEQTLAELWSQALCVERIGRHDNFFDLGGQSLLAMRLVSRIRSVFKVELPLRALFEAPSVAALAPRLDRADVARPALAARARPDAVPLSFAQRRLWLLGQIEGRSPTYNIPLALRLDGKLDAAALEAALSDLVARHESLRTVFEERDGTALQRVLPVAAARVAFERVNAGEVTLPDLLAQAAGYSFDLASELPIRASLFRLGAERHVLLLLLHHIAGDGWSLAPLARDLASAYGARHRGEAPGWAALPVQYVDYTLWQHELLGREEDPESRIAQQLGYWRTQLANLPEQIELPSDRPRPAVASRRGGLFTFSLDAALHGRLLALARTGQASLFMVLQAGLAALLSRLGAGTDIVLGSPIAGRVDDALEDLVGFFVNTLVLRTDLSGDPSAKALLARVREVDLGGYAHQDLPFERLVELLNPPRSLGRHPLFQIMLVLQNNAGARFELPGLNAAAEPVGTGTTKFDLTFGFAEQQRADGTVQGLEASIEYATDLFDRASIETLAERLIRMLSAMAAAPDQAISRIELLAPSERQRLLVEWNDTAQPLPEATLAALFEAQVARDPTAIAVMFGEERLSYGELDARAERLARTLVAQGVGPEIPVGLLMARSPGLVVAILAILKAGGAYLPLHEDAPDARLADQLSETGATLLLTDHRLAGREFGPAVRILTVGDAMPAPASTLPRRHPGQLAYVMYTSGSTGKPKGIGVTDRDVAALAFDRRWRDGTQDRVLLHSPLAFDASTYELWVPLLNGGTLVVAPPGELDLEHLAQTIERGAVTSLWLTAGLFELVAQERPACLARVRRVLAGGDVVSPQAVRRVLEACPGILVTNGYGPTETTTFALSHDVAEPPRQAVPLGRPLDNMRVHVLDEQLNLVPAGACGELYIAGAGLARGYVGRAGLTAERFVACPFGPPGARLYRTGDLVRRREDGVIEFLGRADEQLKLRGFRIEPGEIEAALLAEPEVAQAAVLVRSDRPGEKRLVGYVVARPGAECEPVALRSRLAARLPAYMVPAILALDALPLTANGKLDRRALPAPALAPAAQRAPRTPLEASLAALFAELLGLERIGIDDNFFDLGGHSLLATRLVSRIRSTIGVGLPLRALFEAPSVAQLIGPIDALLLLGPVPEADPTEDMEHEMGIL